MSNNKLSAIIITFNEERNIARCLESLEGIADEVIVVDSLSTDKTKEICIEKGVKFIEHSFEGHIQQKNFAMRQANNDYVISLDADEALSAELKKSILKEKENFEFDAYTFNRLNNYCGKWIKHCGWYPDTKLRIWNKNKGKWGGENPHDVVLIDNESSIKHLNGDLLHYSYYSINDHIKQIHFFTDIAAASAFNKGKKTTILALIIKPIVKFLKDYIIKGGFLDGYYGLIICINSAYANYLKYLKLNELNRKNH